MRGQAQRAVVRGDDQRKVAAAVGRPLAARNDILKVLPGTLDAPRLKDEILSSALCVIRYDGGVDWAGDPVTFVIGIAGRGDEHLEILSQIAILFSEEDDVARLAAAGSEEELFGMLAEVNG